MAMLNQSHAHAKVLAAEEQLLEERVVLLEPRLKRVEEISHFLFHVESLRSQ